MIILGDGGAGRDVKNKKVPPPPQGNAGAVQVPNQFLDDQQDSVVDQGDYGTHVLDEEAMHQMIGSARDNALDMNCQIPLCEYILFYKKASGTPIRPKKFIPPSIATPGSNGIDIPYNRGTCVVQPSNSGTARCIPYGIHLCLFSVSHGHPVSFCIRPRSSTALKSSLRQANTAAVIDSDYTGEICWIVDVFPASVFPNGKGGSTPAQVQYGNRYIQACLPMPGYVSEIYEVETFPNENTKRGDQGMGSTGE